MYADVPSIFRQILIVFSAAISVALILSIQTPAQALGAPVPRLGQIMGTVTDVRGDPVVDATVTLASINSSTQRTLLTGQNGFFEFDGVQPGVTYQVVINASGFAGWTSPEMSLEPGQVKLLGSISLRLATQRKTVTVMANPIHIATEQIRAEETQRVLGIIPNFYVSYEGNNAAPLTTKMKFELAIKVSYDPVTLGGVGLLAGMRQAASSPNYPQDAKGYGKWFGAISADGFTDIMIGGAILPSLLHEDPRYFYQGTGSVKSRLRHAVLSAFVSKRDNGSWGPNYSSLGGDLASSALSNFYYPKSNRGVRLVFSSFAVGTAERIVASVAQEFILSKFTHRGGHVEEASEK